MAGSKEDYVDLTKSGERSGPKKKRAKEKTHKKSKRHAERGKRLPVPEKTGKPEPDAMAKKRSRKKEAPKEVKSRVETNIDRLYELIRDKGILKSNVAAKKLKIDNEMIEEWGRVLEDHKLVKMHYPPIGEPVFILKKFKASKEGVVEKKEKLKPGRKIFIINIIILLCFFAFVTITVVRIPTFRVSYAQLYLGTLAVIIIVGGIITFKFRGRLKALTGGVLKDAEKEDKEKGGEKVGKAKTGKTGK